MAPDASRAPLTKPAKTTTYFRKRRPRGVTRLSCRHSTTGRQSRCRTTRRSSRPPASPRQYHQQARDRFFQATLDLVTADAEHLLALGGRIIDVPVLAHELPEREHGPVAGLVEGAQHLLLEPGHRQDQVRLGEEVAVALEVGRGEVILGQVDALLTERQARVERGDHAISRVVGDPSRPDADGAIDALPRQHPLQERLGHHASRGIGVAYHENGLHGSSYRDFQKRRPPPRSRHSSAGRSSSFWPNSMLGGCFRWPPSVSGKIFTSSSGSQRRPALMCRTAWGWASRV